MASREPLKSPVASKNHTATVMNPPKALGGRPGGTAAVQDRADLDSRAAGRASRKNSRGRPRPGIRYSAESSGPCPSSATGPDASIGLPWTIRSGELGGRRTGKAQAPRLASWWRWVARRRPDSLAAGITQAYFDELHP